MPYSHHSHSGQFCSHATDTLEEVIKTAISKGFHTLALTEHIPRHAVDLYPEEARSHTEESLVKLFDDYVEEAQRLRGIYSSKINLLIGFESEWIRPETLSMVQKIQVRNCFDVFIGSVHHTHTIPVDYDRATYERARDKAGGTDEKLFQDYFDSQFEMLQALRPPIVGHFDLIRLLSDHRDSQFQGMRGVWTRIQRNLEFIASYDGLLELNSAGLRKGLAEPYPCLVICNMFAELKGGFVMSDDSHGVDQVGTNYARLLSFIQKAGIAQIHYANPSVSGAGGIHCEGGFSTISTMELAKLSFWTSQSGG